MDFKASVERAHHRLGNNILETPLQYSPYFSELCGAKVFFKAEHLQFTGSFKARGALNKLLSLTDAQRAQGVVAASSGNHGAAVAYASQKLNVQAIIFVPKNAVPTKISNIRRYGAQVKMYGEDMADTQTEAIAFSKKHQKIFISPYDDPDIIFGQGTLAIDILKQLPKTEVIFVAVGGGGLISGVSGYLKETKPDIRIFGCSPSNSPIMAQLYWFGHVKTTPKPTLSDGTGGGVVPGSITETLCRKYVDQFFLVTEEEIAAAVLELIEQERFLVEGAGGAPLAVLLKYGKELNLQEKHVVVILSGGNIGLANLQKVMSMKKE